MKILFLCSAIFPEGTYIRAYGLARSLVRRGHSVTLIKVSATSRVRIVKQEQDGIKLLEMPPFWGMRWFRHGLLPSDIIGRIWHVLTHKYDVIHSFSHFLNNFLPWAIAKHLSRGHIFVNDWCDLWASSPLQKQDTQFSPLRFRIERWLEYQSRMMADGVSVISTSLERKVINWGLPKECVIKLPITADLKSIYPIPLNEARQKVGINYSGIILLYASNIISALDQQLLVDAINLLVDQGKDFRLMLLGLSANSLSKEFDSRCLTKWIIQIGHVPQKLFKYYLCAADIALLPYQNIVENRFRFPNKLADYLSAGKPVVSQEVGEVGKFINHYSVGLISGESAGEFASSISTLMENKKLREAYGKRSYQVAKRLLNCDFQATRLEKFYRHLYSLKN